MKTNSTFSNTRRARKSFELEPFALFLSAYLAILGTQYVLMYRYSIGSYPVATNLRGWLYLASGFGLLWTSLVAPRGLLRVVAAWLAAAAILWTAGSFIGVGGLGIAIAHGLLAIGLLVEKASWFQRKFATRIDLLGFSLGAAPLFVGAQELFRGQTLQPIAAIGLSAKSMGLLFTIVGALTAISNLDRKNSFRTYAHSLAGALQILSVIAFAVWYSPRILVEGFATLFRAIVTAFLPVWEKELSQASLLNLRVRFAAAFGTITWAVSLLTAFLAFKNLPATSLPDASTKARLVAFSVIILGVLLASVFGALTGANLARAVRSLAIASDSGESRQFGLNELDEVAGFVAKLKAAEESVRKAEQRMRIAQEAAREGTWEWNLQTGKVIWSAEQEALYGLAPGSFTGDIQQWRKMVHPEDLKNIDRLRQKISDQKAAQFEAQYRITRTDGAQRWIETFARVVYHESGTPVQMIGVNIDITERKQNEQTDSLLAAIVGSSDDAIISKMLDGIITSWNKGAEQIFGYTSQEAIGQSIFLIIPEDRRSEEAEIINRLKKGESVDHFDTIRRRKDGTPVHLSLTISPIRDTSGNVVGASKIARDITERKQAEETVRVRNRQLDLLASTSQLLIMEQLPDDRTLEKVFVDIGRLLGMEMCYHYRPSEDPRLLRLATFGGVTEEERKLFGEMRLGELLCGQVAETRKRLVLEDLSTNVQPGSELLAGTGARSYAGFPLMAGPEFHGTLAFISRHRTHFQDGEIRMVQTICDQIAVTLERSRLMTELQASEERTRLALEGADLGFWDVDLRTGAVVWNHRHRTLLGYRKNTQPVSISHWRDLVHPDDLDRVTKLIEGARLDRNSLAVEHRFYRADTRELRWLSLYGRFIYNDRDEAIRFSGVSLDITKRKEYERTLELLANLQVEFAPLLTSAEIMATACKLVGKHLALSHCLLVEIKEDAGIAEVVCDHHSSGTIDLKGTYKIEEFHTEQERCQMAAGRPILISNTQRLHPVASAEKFAALGIGSLLNVPQLSNGRWKFVLGATHDAPHEWTSAEIELLQDITARIHLRLERARAEEALCASEERLRLAVEAGELATWSWDIRTGDVVWNDEHYRMLGYEPGSVVPSYEAWVERVHMEDREKMEARLHTALKSGGYYCAEFRVVWPDKSVHWIEARGRFERDASGEAVRNYGLMRDVTAQKQAEIALRNAHLLLEQRVAERTQELATAIESVEKEIVIRRAAENKLRQLSASLMRTQDEERRRIARELHDSTGQTLSGLKMSLSNLQRECEKGNYASDLFDDSLSLADQAIQEIRTTSYLLHPPLLDEAGFRSAAQWYIQGFEKRSGIKVSFATGGPATVPSDLELVLFRVLQESLTNILRHSGATTADVRLDADQEAVKLQVRDYGKGIPPELLEQFRTIGDGVGVGLAGMRERIEQLHGYLQITSDFTGTTVNVTLPKTTASKIGNEAGGFAVA